MLKTSIGPGRRLAGACAVGLLCGATAAGAWAAKPAEVRVAAPGKPARVALIPEMTPTGEMIPAYGSYPAGTPAAHIAVTTPVMTPTGAMRPVFVPTARFAGQQASAAPQARGSLASIEGELVRVMFANGQSQLTIRTPSGAVETVAGDAPDSMVRQGFSPRSLRPGMPIRADGVRDADGVLRVSGSGFSSNGQRIATHDVNGQPYATGGEARGGITDRSALTNSVIRDGEPRAVSQPMRTPRVVKVPTVDELMAAFPSRAMRLEQSGAANLDCTLGADGGLADCSSDVGGPDELGFGHAAMQLAPAFRLDTLDANGQSMVGQKVRIPVKFELR